MTSKELQKEINRLADKEKAVFLSRYFKTGKGEYGEGDIFLGLTVPQLRSIAKKYKAISIKELKPILMSKYHEYRLLALIILVYKFNEATKEDDEKTRKHVYSFYIRHKKYINNWDLVDVTCRDIVGGYLYDKPKEKEKLFKALSNSKSIWDRRIAIISTFYFLNKGEYSDTVRLAEKYLNDTHDLIHKASGWALREVGKKDEKVLVTFLKEFTSRMPRTMYRYSTEILKKKYPSRF